MKKESIDARFDERFDGLWLDGMQDYKNDKSLTRQETIDSLKAFIHTVLDEQREDAAKIMYLILPLARGYVAKNNHGANQRYIDMAENYISRLTNKGE